MAFVTMFCLMWFSGVAPATGVLGDWKGPTGAIVRMHPCGSSVCAKIVKLAATVPDKTDAKNPDGGLRSRPLCGLDIGTGFRQVDPMHLEDGRLYDPESGRTYTGTISTNGDEMKLRGYIGISLLGRTEVWKRVAPVEEAACH